MSCKWREGRKGGFVGKGGCCRMDEGEEEKEQEEIQKRGEY